MEEQGNNQLRWWPPQEAEWGGGNTQQWRLHQDIAVQHSKRWQQLLQVTMKKIKRHQSTAMMATTRSSIEAVARSSSGGSANTWQGTGARGNITATTDNEILKSNNQPVVATVDMAAAFSMLQCRASANNARGQGEKWGVSIGGTATKCSKRWQWPWQAAMTGSSSGVAWSLTTQHFSAASSDCCYSHDQRSNCQEQQLSIGNSEDCQKQQLSWHSAVRGDSNCYEKLRHVGKTKASVGAESASPSTTQWMAAVGTARKNELKNNNQPSLDHKNI